MLPRAHSPDHCLPSRRLRTTLLRGLAIASAAMVALATGLATPASAHGSVINPATRNYGCLERWGNNHMAPEMQTEDPMCYQAFQANPNAMWNWNGLYRGNVGGNHQAAVPNGTLCSGGNTESGRYDFLDTPGPWIATNVGNSFTVQLFDQASHGADYIWVYVTRQGFDPLTERLGWDDLERVATVGNRPASTWQQVTSPAAGVRIDIPVSVSGRSGRHIVYTLWQASHMDQPYYLCSDVRFPGGPADPTTPPPTEPTTPPTDPPTNPGNGACTAAYRNASTWSGGFQGEVTVTAGSATISGWTVTMTFPSGTTVTNAWNATVSTSGSTVTARNVGYNGSVAAGSSTSFGFIGSGSGGAPTLSCSAT